MVATRAAGASARPRPSPGPRREPRQAPRPAPLRVVGPDVSSPSVGALGSAIAAFLFATLLALAGLHAALVQAQAGLDDVVEQNGVRRDRVDELLAEVAHLDSPEGVAEQARGAGLLAAPEVVTIAPLAPGALAAPPPDPFGPAPLVPTAGAEGTGG